jgi:hypothetical protein
MPSTYTTHLACRSCHPTYSDDRWLAEHGTTHYTHCGAYEPGLPPAGTDHAERGIPFSRNHDPLVDDVLMPDVTPAGSALPDSMECTPSARVDCFPNAGTPVLPTDHAVDTAGNCFNPSCPWQPLESEADFRLAQYMVEYLCAGITSYINK